MSSPVATTPTGGRARLQAVRAHRRWAAPSMPEGQPRHHRDTRAGQSRPSSAASSRPSRVALRVPTMATRGPSRRPRSPSAKSDGRRRRIVGRGGRVVRAAPDEHAAPVGRVLGRAAARDRSLGPPRPCCAPPRGCPRRPTHAGRRPARAGRRRLPRQPRGDRRPGTGSSVAGPMPASAASATRPASSAVDPTHARGSVGVRPVMPPAPDAGRRRPAAAAPCRRGRR